MATPAAHAIEVHHGPAPEVTAFNFVCGCGNNLIARVPAEESEVNVLCNRCNKPWRLLWKGDHFQTFSGERTGRLPDIARGETAHFRENMRRIGADRKQDG